MKIYSNTTPLLAFAAIERFDILQAVHRQIHVVESVWKECQAGLPIMVPNLMKMDWVCLVDAPQEADGRFLALDAGERDTISEALSDKADLVLIDERLGRNLAEDRRYIDKSASERLRTEYKDLSKSIGALASKLRSQQ